MSFNNTYKQVINELDLTLDLVDDKEVEQFIEALYAADKIFFVGVGRVLLSLEAIAKRFSHLGLKCFVVGQITEPAITENDLLIVGSGSGESLFPVQIAKKAKEYNAKVAHIGSDRESTMEQYRDYFIQISTETKFSKEDEVKSAQPMTSLFEQSLLLLGDTIAMIIIEDKNIDMTKLWKYHANLE